MPVLFIPTNVRFVHVNVVARTAWSIGLHEPVVVTTQGVPKVNQESGFLTRILGPLVKCNDWGYATWWLRVLGTQRAHKTY